MWRAYPGIKTFVYIFPRLADSRASLATTDGRECDTRMDGGPSIVGPSRSYRIRTSFPMWHGIAWKNVGPMVLCQPP